MSIKETVESFIKFRRSIGRKDQSTTYSLRLFAKFIGETTELTSITESDCNAFLYRKGNVITRYWHSQHCILKKLFEWAFSRGLIWLTILLKASFSEIEFLFIKRVNCVFLST